MSISKSSLLVTSLILTLSSCTGIKQASPEGPRLGQVASLSDIKRLDISVAPDGLNLPVGHGNAKSGALVYQSKCQSCHGEKGKGKPADALVGGINTLTSNNPVRTVGSFWPYASTLFDYTRRAMPLNNPKSLSNDEVYAVSAYILYLNGVINEDFEVNQKTLSSIQMPNRNGFVDFSKMEHGH